MTDRAAGPSPATSTRRPHLDGARTLAVYLVVAFHAGVAPLSGGFIGVDLFFVLSGYLVTGLLVRDLGGDGSTGMLRFYARRARRLLPAALVALLVTAAAYAAVASPAQAEASTDDFRAAALYVSNWHFIAEATDYFAADIDGSPVLHYWSLSVEEQYYLLWPLVLLGLWRVLRPSASPARYRSLVAVVAAAAAGSLVWALVLRDGASAHAYFGTDARAYQLLAGALLALLPSVLASRPVRRVAPVAGPAGLAILLGVASSLIEMDPVERGVVAMVGTVLLLAALECGRRTWLTTAFSVRPAAYLGRISYATYLWHWPVVVLLREADVVLRPLVLAPVVAVVATAAAALSERFLELPIRTSPALDARPTGVVLAGIGASLASGLVLLPMLTSGSGAEATVLMVVGLLASVAAAVVVARRRRSDGAAGPLVGRRARRLSVAAFGAVALIATSVGAQGGARADGEPIDWRAARDDASPVAPCTAAALDDCVVVEGEGPTVMLIGDSHARMFVPSFRAAAEELDLRLVVATSPGCPWLVDVVPLLFTEACADQKPDWYGPVLDEFDPDVVVLAQRGFQDPRSPMVLAAADGFFETGEPGFDDLLEAQTAATLDVVATGGRRVVFVEGVPQPPNGESPIDCISSGDPSTCTFEAPALGSFEQVQRDVAGSRADVWSFDLDADVCPDRAACPAVIDDVVVWRDESHLTQTFATGLGSVLAELLVDEGVLDGT